MIAAIKGKEAKQEFLSNYIELLLGDKKQVDAAVKVLSQVYKEEGGGISEKVRQSMQVLIGAAVASIYGLDVDEWGPWITQQIGRRFFEMEVTVGKDESMEMKIKEQTASES